MAQIEVRKYGISGVFLDGYMPDFSEIKKTDWDYVLEHKLSKATYMIDRFMKIRKHLESPGRDPPIIIQAEIYDRLIKATRHRFCPYTTRFRGLCNHWFRPSKGFLSMRYTFSKDPESKPDATSACFYADIEVDKEKGMGEYASNLFVIDRRQETGCQIFHECNKNWMDLLKFKKKRKSDYSDFNIIRQLAKEILIDHMIMMEYEFFDDRRLRVFFRQSF